MEHWDWFGIPCYAVMLNHSCFSDTNPEKGIILLSNSYHYKRLIDIVQHYKKVLVINVGIASSTSSTLFVKAIKVLISWLILFLLPSTEHGLLIHTSHLPGLKDTLLQPMHHKLSF